RSQLYERLGQYDDALEGYNRALELAEDDRATQEQKDKLVPLERALAYHYRGCLFYARHQYGPAEDDLVKARKLREGLRRDDLVPDTVETLAPVHYATAKSDKDYQRAEEEFRTSLETLKGLLGRGAPKVVVNQHNLAALYRTTGQFDKARELYDESIKGLE